MHQEAQCLKRPYLFCQKNNQVPGFNCDEFTDSLKNIKQTERLVTKLRKDPHKP